MYSLCILKFQLQPKNKPNRVESKSRETNPCTGGSSQLTVHNEFTGQNFCLSVSVSRKDVIPRYRMKVSEAVHLCSRRRWTMVRSFYQQISGSGSAVSGSSVNFSWFLTTNRGSAMFQSLSKYAAVQWTLVQPYLLQPSTAHLAKVVCYPPSLPLRYEVFSSLIRSAGSCLYKEAELLPLGTFSYFKLD